MPGSVRVDRAMSKGAPTIETEMRLFETLDIGVRNILDIVKREMEGSGGHDLRLELDILKSNANTLRETLASVHIEDRAAEIMIPLFCVDAVRLHENAAEYFELKEDTAESHELAAELRKWGRDVCDKGSSICKGIGQDWGSVVLLDYKKRL
jgi:hypothetical protein